MESVKRYTPDGSVRAVWRDEFAERERAQKGGPRRASRIEVIESGDKAGLFHVDMSLLAEATGDWRFRVCLAKTFSAYGDANRAEVAWLEEHYVRGPLDGRA